MTPVEKKACNLKTLKCSTAFSNSAMETPIIIAHRELNFSDASEPPCLEVELHSRIDGTGKHGSGGAKRQ